MANPVFTNESAVQPKIKARAKCSHRDTIDWFVSHDVLFTFWLPSRVEAQASGGTSSDHLRRHLLLS